MNKKFIAVAVASALSASGYAAEISGKIIVEDSNKGVSKAKVSVRGLDQTTTTDANGQFTLDLPAGSYTIVVEAGKQGHFHESLQVSESNNPEAIFSISRHQENKIVVRANPLEHTKVDMATPTILLTGEDLALRKSSTLGDILQNEPGISMSSFGPAVSRPVIRGLSGSRVRITSNQMSVQDASTVSADHDVSLEPLLAEQIEVVKGPATLIYGSGAIGGVINVVDNRINPNSDEELNGAAEFRLGDGATGEQSLVFALNGGSDDWRWHLDGYDSSTDDIEIPGTAESEILHESEGHDDDGDGDDEEVVGLLENSFSETQGFSLGSTWITDSGYWGVSFNQLEKQYGLPGGHGHHEEDDHGAGDPDHDEEEEESVSLDMEQTRIDIRGEINQPFTGFKNLFIGYSYTDYGHVEIEGTELGTMFDNEAWELRSHLQHNVWEGWNGILGIQFNSRDFSAIGEEAFVPPSETTSSAIFAVEEKDFGNLKWELGGRLESVSVEAEGINGKYDESLFSFSSGLVYSLDARNKIAFNLSRSARAPEAEELYSSGPHIATRTFEIGDPTLEKEVSTNIDLSYRFHTESVNGEINLYLNQFDDYIFQEIVDPSDPGLDPDDVIEAEEEELLIARYAKSDAQFGGVEIKLNFPIVNDQDYDLSFGLMADFIEAEFDSDGAYVPRVPPLKYGADLHFDKGGLSAQLRWTSFQSQDKIAANELPTEGFDLLDLELAYIISEQKSDYFIFLKGSNLLDEEARDHASFLKDLAPRAGRSFVAGLRVTF